MDRLNGLKMPRVRPALWAGGRARVRVSASARPRRPSLRNRGISRHARSHRSRFCQHLPLQASFARRRDPAWRVDRPPHHR